MMHLSLGSPRNKRLVTVLLALLVASVYLFLRIFRINLGLPYVDYWDEAQVAWAGTRIALGPEWTTTFFNYGNLPIYLTALSVGPVFLWYQANGEELLLENVLPFGDYPWLVDYGEVMFVARSLWMVAGLLTVLGVFFVLNKFFGLTAATSGAVLLAVNPMHILFSTRIAPDGLAASLAFASLGLATVYLVRRSNYLLHFSVLFGALAAATKYNYGTVVFAAVLAYFLVGRDERLSKKLLNTVALAGTAAVTFALAMPSAIVNPRAFLAGVLYEIDHYQSGHNGHESDPWLGQMVFQFGELNVQWGIWALFLALIGAAGLLLRRGLERRVFILWTLPFVPFLLVMLSGTVNFHRNYLLLYPVVALFAGAGIHYLVVAPVTWLKAGVPRAVRIVSGVLVLTTSLLPNLPNGIRSSIENMSSKDSRKELVETVGTLEICSQVEQVLIDDRIFISPRQWLRYCPENTFTRLGIDEIEMKPKTSPTAIVALPGDYGLGEPLQVFNEQGGYAGFGPDFNPPLSLYIFEPK